MIDDYVEVHSGDTRPITATVTMASGSASISGQPWCKLLTQAGGTVADVGSVPATGYTQGTAGTVSVWYNLASGTIPPGLYTLQFGFLALGSDAMTRAFHPEVGVAILAVGSNAR